jgi:PAS domain S-box-containing protein
MNDEGPKHVDDAVVAAVAGSSVVLPPETAAVTIDALRASEERFRLLADNIAQLAWMADAEGWIFWYNRRWFDYTGTTLQDMEGWGWRKVHHPDHVERVVDKIQRSFESGEAWEDLFPLRGKDGGYRWFLSRAMPIRNAAGQLLCWFGTNTDVTEQRRAEERLREGDRRKNEFIAMLGHELRNPLAAIRNAAALIDSLQIDQPQLQQAMRVLERQSTHMARLIDGLLDASRIAHGKIELARAPVDLSVLVHRVLQDLAVQAQARTIALQLDAAPGPFWMFGDATRLTQVIENLVGNALKFSAEGATVTVRLERVQDHGVLSVRDQGQGIRPEMLSRIFQPFEQELQDVSRPEGGLGLGLAVAKGLVELHAGRIEARSEGVGKGAELVVTLPLMATEPDCPSPSPGPTGFDKPAQSPALVVLIVEDNVDAGTMLSLLLERRGHSVCLVHTGQEGLAELRARRFDAVLCDLGLPDMSGHDFARTVRSEAGLSHLLLIATTGYGQRQDKERSHSAGFDRHLTKPVDIVALEQALAAKA